MSLSYFSLFDTSMGWCGAAWRDGRTPLGEATRPHRASITRFVLPSFERRSARRRLTAHRQGIHADSGRVLRELDESRSPPWIEHLFARVRAHLDGDLTDFVDVPVDLTALAASTRKIYAATRAISPGQTLTYGEVATSIGQPGGAQAVGAAMGRNPVPLLVPCHRVVGADGRLVGFSAEGGVELKRRLLDLEQAAVVAQRTLF